MKETKQQTIKRSLTAALGQRFTVFVPPRAQKVVITCRKCLVTWSFPGSTDCTYLSEHRCDRHDLDALASARMRRLENKPKMAEIEAVK